MNNKFKRGLKNWIKTKEKEKRLKELDGTTAILEDILSREIEAGNMQILSKIKQAIVLSKSIDNTNKKQDLKIRYYTTINNVTRQAFKQFCNSHNIKIKYNEKEAFNND